MHKPSVTFRTNIDCCRRFLGNISGLPVEMINPLLGDNVRVYHDSGFEIWMKVVERQWKMINGTSPELTCYLSDPNGMTIPEFERVLKSRGFSIS